MMNCCDIRKLDHLVLKLLQQEEYTIRDHGAGKFMRFSPSEVVVFIGIDPETGEAESFVRHELLWLGELSTKGYTLVEGFVGRVEHLTTKQITDKKIDELMGALK